MAMDEELVPEPLGPEKTEFVPAVFARNSQEAAEYCELLNDHDIPATVGSDEHGEDAAQSRRRGAGPRRSGRRGMTRGVPVLVPETLLDEASEIIAEREEFVEINGGDEEDEDEDDEIGGGDDQDEAPDEEEPEEEVEDAYEDDDLDELVPDSESLLEEDEEGSQDEEGRDGGDLFGDQDDQDQDGESDDEEY